VPMFYHWYAWWQAIVTLRLLYGQSTLMLEKKVKKLVTKSIRRVEG